MNLTDLIENLTEMRDTALPEMGLSADDIVVVRTSDDYQGYGQYFALDEIQLDT